MISPYFPLRVPPTDTSIEDFFRDHPELEEFFEVNLFIMDLLEFCGDVIPYYNVWKAYETGLVPIKPGRPFFEFFQHRFETLQQQLLQREKLEGRIVNEQKNNS